LKLTRTREFVVNMGNYESFRTSATVEIESYDIETAEGKAEILLDAALKDDLQSAANLSDVRNTYILTWNKEKY
jgi:hypothetical protein